MKPTWGVAALALALTASVSRQAAAQDTSASGAGLTVAPASFASLTVRENQRRLEGAFTLRFGEQGRLVTRLGVPLDERSLRAPLLTDSATLIGGITGGVEMLWDQGAVRMTQEERNRLGGLCELWITVKAAQRDAAVLQAITRILALSPTAEEQTELRANQSLIRNGQGLSDSFSALTRLASATHTTNREAWLELRESTAHGTSLPSCNASDSTVLAEVYETLSDSERLEALPSDVRTRAREVSASMRQRERLGVQSLSRSVRWSVGANVDASYDRVSAYVGALPSPGSTGALPDPTDLDSWQVQGGAVIRLFAQELDLFSLRLGGSVRQKPKLQETRLCLPTTVGTTMGAQRCEDVNLVDAAPSVTGSLYARLAWAHLFNNVVNGSIPGVELRAAVESWDPGSSGSGSAVFGASVFYMPTSNTTRARYGLGVDVTVPFNGGSVSAVPFVLVGVTP